MKDILMVSKNIYEEPLAFTIKTVIKYILLLCSGRYFSRIQRSSSLQNDLLLSRNKNDYAKSTGAYFKVNFSMFPPKDPNTHALRPTQTITIFITTQKNV